MIPRNVAPPNLNLEINFILEILLLQIAIVKIAVEKDMKNEAQEAVHHYCKALQYFMPAIRCKYMVHMVHSIKIIFFIRYKAGIV